VRWRVIGRIILAEHFLCLGVQHVQAQARVEYVAAQLHGRVKHVEALYELLKHELFHVRPVDVQYLIPNEKQTQAVDFYEFGIANVQQLVQNATDAAHLPTMMDALGL
jgi:hypothetical protein